MERCPTCGREVYSIFDHIDIIDCAALPPQTARETLAAWLEAPETGPFEISAAAYRSLMKHINDLIGTRERSLIKHISMRIMGRHMSATERFEKFMEARRDLAPEIGNFRSIIISLLEFHAEPVESRAKEMLQLLSKVQEYLADETQHLIESFCVYKSFPCEHDRGAICENCRDWKEDQFDRSSLEPDELAFIERAEALLTEVNAMIAKTAAE